MSLLLLEMCLCCYLPPGLLCDSSLISTTIVTFACFLLLFQLLLPPPSFLLEETFEHLSISFLIFSIRLTTSGCVTMKLALSNWISGSCLSSPGCTWYVGSTVEQKSWFVSLPWRASSFFCLASSESPRQT